MKQAVILAGGKGTRLRERLGDLPKPLVEIGGMPLLERQVLLLKRYGCEEILLLVNDGAEFIRRFCVARQGWGISVECLDDGEPRGTAGAVLNVLHRLEEEVLALYGDTLIEVDLARFVSYHRARPDGAATLFVHPNDHPHDSDLVEVSEDGRITAFHPYPHPPDFYGGNLVNAALYCLRTGPLGAWRDSNPPMDFGKDLFPAMLDCGLTLHAYNSPEYVKDCGTPARLDKICADLASGRVAGASLTNQQAAVFLDRDGTINPDLGYIDHHSRFELFPGAASAIRRLNSSEYRTVVITNQSVVARGDCTVAELKHIHDKMETLLGREGAYLDRIYYCPHHPEHGFAGEVPGLKVDCTCRKPRTGMIDRAVADLNIDPLRSWLIGDSTVDMLTARRAGLRAVLVETGQGGLDRRHWTSSDYSAPDIAAAVSFILDEHPRLMEVCGRFAPDISDGDFVFIGGLSRSGKSSFAAALAEAFRSARRPTALLTTDRWLRSRAGRQPGVLGRHDLDHLVFVLGKLAGAAGEVVLNVPAYDKVDRQSVPDAEQLIVPPNAVIIVEGVAAFFAARAALTRRCRFFVIEIDETRRRERVIREYLRRGCSLAEAEAIYWDRERDETPEILGSIPDRALRVVPPGVA